jgi:hypothetical protein
MEELYELLRNPFDGLSKDEDTQERCRRIAQELFDNYCIKCKEKEYYFAEIEFYYWQKDRWEKDWNKVTYPRDGYKAKDLFFHTSGIDICFESSYDDAKFGGILVRSVIDKENNIIAGPWNCMLHILNECKGGEMPRLEKSQPRSHIPQIKATYRALGEKDIINEKKGPLSLCFYDAIPEDRWRFEKESYDKATGKRIYPKTYYKKDRFSL